MKQIAVVQDGKVINVGSWDYLNDAEGNATNPLPKDATEGEFDVVVAADGRYVLAGAYRDLRRAEYPSVGDQLDSLFKAGVFPADMAEQIAAVKAKYPKAQ